MKLIAIRHAQTEFNEQNRIQGKMDIPLSKHGLENTEKLAKRFSDETILRIYTSDLSRTYQTALKLLNDIDKIVKDERLRERSYGEWEGCTWMDVRRTHPYLRLLKKIKPLDWRAPGGESIRNVFARIIDFLKSELIPYIDSLPSGVSGTIIIVSHNTPIRCLKAISLGINPKKYEKINHIPNLTPIILNIENIRENIKNINV